MQSVRMASEMRITAALLGLLGASSAVAAPITIERDLIQQQLQALTQQVAIAQQQIEQTPNARAQLGIAVQQLQSAQTQISELMRLLTMAPSVQASASPYGPAPSPQYAPSHYPPSQYPPAQYPSPQAPPYAPPAPQYPPPAPQYPSAAPPSPYAAPPSNYPAPPSPYAVPPSPPQAPPVPQAPPPNYQNAMSDANFQPLLQQLAGTLSNDKLNLLRQSVVGNYFLVEQVARILPLYVYTADRVAALQVIAPHILDRQSGFKLLSLFQYSDDRDKAQRILHGAPPPPSR